VPDINDFTKGLKAALKPNGTITLEFPHLMQLIRHNQFDTIYHEHLFYLSLHTVSQIFQRANSRIWYVEQLPTHGGSLRIYGCHQEDPRETSEIVTKLLALEAEQGLKKLETYLTFQKNANKVKNELVQFLIKQKNPLPHTGQQLKVMLC